MATIEDILLLVEGLTPFEKDELRAKLMENSIAAPSIEKLVSEDRFSGGLVCPHCGCLGHIVRNGHRSDGRQRYKCRDCDKSFLAATNSIASGTRKELKVWKLYMECMINKLPIRKTAEICGIHRNTAFIWRHKILDALQKVANQTNLRGIIEADETFFPLSFKGNHKHSSTFKMPRTAHKRGKAISTRGISKEQVCVPCAIDRTGNSLSKIATLGRVRTKDLHKIYDGKIIDKSVFCTDKMNSYVRFAKSNGIELVQLKTGKSKKGIDHIQHINAYHSKLKAFIRIFKGVATKYLNNYLLWNNWINSSYGTLRERVDRIIKVALTTRVTVKCALLSRRSPVPLA